MLLVVPPSETDAFPALTEAALTAIGRRVFDNECGGQRERLLDWNPGEDFLSLGIGHFIWYPFPAGPYQESFPDLLADLRHHGVPLPVELARAGPGDCPWPNRTSFLAARHTPRAERLRRFLADTVGDQTRYLVARLRRARPRILAAVAPPLRPVLARRFDSLAATAPGLFAMVDYVNFKGEGLAAGERVGAQGWGLLQVLTAMTDGDADPVAAFSRAAEQVLRRRAAASVEARRWLPGWLARVRRYGLP